MSRDAVPAAFAAQIAGGAGRLDRPWIAYAERLLARAEASRSPRVRDALLAKVEAALPRLVRPSLGAPPPSPAEEAARARLHLALAEEGLVLDRALPLATLAHTLYEQARAALTAARDLAQALAAGDADAGPYNPAALAADAFREAARLSRLYLGALLGQVDLYRALAVLPPAPEPAALKGPGRRAPAAKKTAKKRVVDKSKSLKAQLRPGGAKKRSEPAPRRDESKE